MSIIERTCRLIDFNVFARDESKTDSAEGSSGEEDTQVGKKKEDSVIFAIQMFGIDERGAKYSIVVDDYKPFFYVKVPESWGQTKKGQFMNHIKRCVGAYYAGSISSSKLIKRKKLYGFDSGKEYRFIIIEFNNIQVFNRVKKLWYKDAPSKNGDGRKDQILLASGYKYVGEDNEACYLQIYESNIPPLLRFLHIQDISPTGWIALPVNKTTVTTEENKKTTCDFELYISYKNIIPLNDKETRVPYKICSFDIEASSSHGDFPVPKKSYKKLATNIIDYFDKLGDKLADLSLQECQSKLSDIVLTAFGFQPSGNVEEFVNVDLVFPKRPPSLQNLQRFIQTWMTRKVRVKDDSEELDGLTIESMFESKNKDLYASSAKVCEDGGDGEGDDGDGDGSDNELEPVEPEPAVNAQWYKKKKTQTLGDATVSTIVFDKTIDRTTKMEELNRSLCANFPELEGDKVTFIGSTFLLNGATEPYLNHCIALGTCDDQQNAHIDSYMTEREVLLAWTEIIQKENPDIIIGYNTCGFDFTFMFQRALETGCAPDFLKLSRNLDEVCGTIDYVTKKLKIEESSITVASGTHDLQYIKMNGRVQIDLYNYFRKEENLTSYKLDYVAGHFIGDDIKAVTHLSSSVEEDAEEVEEAITIFKTYNMTGLTNDSYVHIEEIKHSVNYYKNGAKFKVKEVNRESGTFSIYGHESPDIEGSKSVRWCLAKDDVTPQDIFRLTNGTSGDRGIVAKYCIQDCNLVQHLFRKVDVLTGFIEMGKLCSVPISFLVLRGQGIKLLSFVAKKCKEKNTLMPVIEKGGLDDGFEGAIVLEPKCGMYLDDPVAVGDFASLYPSCMLSENISHDSKVWTKEYDLANNLVKETGVKSRSTGEFIYDNLPEYKYVQIKYDTYVYVRDKPTSKAKKVLSGYKICCYAQFPEGTRAIMPSILQELLSARKTTRKLIPQQTDDFMKNVLDKRQLAYKITANSLYGQCGAKTSAFYEQDAAASTTATGRLLLTYAKTVVEECYGDKVCETDKYGPVCTKAEYIYGDSVSRSTPIYVKICGVFHICTVEELAEKYGATNGRAKWVVCKEEGKQEKEYFELTNVETWTESGWTKLYRIIRHVLAPHKKMVRVLTHTGMVDVTDDHSLLTTEGLEISPNDVAIGSKLLHSEIYIPENKEMIDRYVDMNHIDESDDSQLYEARKRLWLISTNLLDISYENSEEIVEMHEIEYEGYVYDLTTDNHHFAAGIGNMVVHNTDSVFFTFHLTTPEGEKIVGEKALEISIEIAKEATHLVSQFLKEPHDFEYEKTFSPFCLLSKKRYVGMLYEHDYKKGKRKEMGICLKRRDSAPIVKDIYGGVIDIFMKEQNLQKAVNFLKKCLQEIVDENVPMDKLIITKSLNSFYKNPKQIAHKVLADRITARDPGNKPKSGDRIPFIYIVGSKKDLQGNKIETPTFIAENHVKVDYPFYITNQIMKPLLQLFGLVLEEMWALKKMRGKINRFKEDVMKLKASTPEDKFQDKLDKLKDKEVKTLLFDDYLRETNNAKNGNRPLTSFFAPAKK